MSVQFWNRYAARYDTITKLQPYRAMLADVAACIPNAAHSLLDAGCGTGEFLCHLGQQRPDLGLVGLDSSPVMLNIAQRKVPHAWLNQADLSLTWPVADNSVDVSISINTLYTMPSPAAFLAEMQRVTKPGGKIIISTPRKEAKMSVLIRQHLQARPLIQGTLDIARMLPAGLPNLRIVNKANKKDYHFFTKEEIQQLAKPSRLEYTYANQNWLFLIDVT